MIANSMYPYAFKCSVLKIYISTIKHVQVYVVLLYFCVILH